ncbi:MAG: ribbon-helix-helix domain-containing protein [Pseudomonadota bacterium]
MEKRSISLNGHRTSIALEPPFWRVLEEIAAARGVSLPNLIGEIDVARLVPTGEDLSSGSPLADMPGLSSALRVYALEDLADRLNRSQRG